MKVVTAIEARFIIAWLMKPERKTLRLALGVSSTCLEEWEIGLGKEPATSTLAIYALLARMTSGQRKKVWSYVRSRRYRQRQRDKVALQPVMVGKDTLKRLNNVRHRLALGGETISDDQLMRYVLRIDEDHKICE